MSVNSAIGAESPSEHTPPANSPVDGMLADNSSGENVLPASSPVYGAIADNSPGGNFLPANSPVDGTLADNSSGENVPIDDIREETNSTGDATEAFVEKSNRGKQRFHVKQASCRFINVYGKDEYTILQNGETFMKHNRREVLSPPCGTDTPGSPTSSGSNASPVHGINNYMNVGRDRLHDSSILACTPNYIAKTAINAVGIPFFAACYAASKVGSLINDDNKMPNSSAIQVGYKALLYSNGIIPTLVGEEADVNSNFRDTPIIVSNHLSYLDGLVLSGVLNFPRFLAKRELSEMPVIGQLLADLDTVFIDRTDPNSRQQVLNLISVHTDQWRVGDRPLLIFPEGTTSNGNAVASFRKGAFVAGKPVRPIALFYDGVWNPSNPDLRLDGDEVSAYTDSEWAAQFFGHLHHSINVKVLPIYTPSEEEKSNADLYAKNVRDLLLSEYLSLKEQFVQSRVENSWKVAAGRTSGSQNYQLGDETRAAVNKMYEWFGWENPIADAPSSAKRT